MQDYDDECIDEEVIKETLVLQRESCTHRRFRAVDQLANTNNKLDRTDDHLKFNSKSTSIKKSKQEDGKKNISKKMCISLGTTFLLCLLDKLDCKYFRIHIFFN